MASRKSSITAELNLAGMQKFKSGLNEAGRSARVFGKDLSGITSGTNVGSSTRWTEMYSQIRLVAGGARMAGSAIKSAFAQDLNVEQLAMSLASVSDGSETLAEQFAALKEAAKLPGLGFTEIAKGSLDLQSVGVEAKTSRDIIIQLGNALATTGKGKEELQGITTALAQMYGKGKVSAEEINQIAERYPAIRAIAATLDKNSPSKFTEGLAAELSKLPRATGTAKDAIDNLGDAWDQMQAGVAAGQINAAVKSIAQGAADALTSTNGFGDRVEKLGRGLRSAVPGAGTPQDPLAKYELTPQEIEKRKQARIDAEKALEAAKEEVLQMDLDITLAESNLAKAKEEHDDAAILSATEELTLLKEKKKLMEATGVTEERAIEHIKRRVKLEQDAANALRDQRRAKEEGRNNRDLQELEAKAGGMSDRRFKKLKKSNDLKNAEEELIAEGYSPEKAKELASRRVNAEERISDDKEREAKGLRPRIRTVTDKKERARNQLNRMSKPDRERLENLSHSESAEETLGRKNRGGISAYQGDDSMAIRPQGRIQGAGRNKAKQAEEKAVNQSPSGGGIGESIGKEIVRELREVKAEIRNIGPTRNDRAKPISVTSR